MNAEKSSSKQTTFRSSDGLELFERQWLPAGNLKATVALIHGAAEHSGRYGHVAKFLNRHGYALAAFDLRGHGHSEGKRLFVRSFDQYVNDAERFVDRLRGKWPKAPLFMLGHSMGGTITTLLVLKEPVHVDGIILSGPLLQLGEGFSPLKVQLATWLGRLLPRVPVEKINADHISRDEAVIDRYNNDPLVYRGWVPASTGAAVMQAIGRIENEEPNLRMPILLLHGTADQLSDVKGSERLYRRAGSEDKSLRLYDGFYHEVLNEPENDRVMADVLEWLESRLHNAEGSA